MSRYLTPAKIGLLALIELYTEGAVPDDGVLPVLSFITSHLIDSETNTPVLSPSDRWKRAESTVSLVISISDFEKLLTPFAAAIGLPGRRLWDCFLEKLWNIDSLHALHEFFSTRSQLLAKTKEELKQLEEAGEPEPEDVVRLSRNSPFGTLARRSALEFTRLRFHDASELWKDYLKYRQITAQYWKRRNPAFGRWSFDSVLFGGEEEWQESTTAIAAVAYGDMLTDNHNGTLPVSTDDIEALLEFQIEQMQRYGTRIPLEIRHQFQDLLGDSFLVPSLSHYLSFLDSWRAGDYTSSFDNLHRYFDYTMQNRDRLFYQYALLNLAVLQADFGCYNEAIAAMLETVSTARENRDMNCLNFALNWLFHFGRAHPRLVSELESNSMLGSGKESLAFLRAKAKETGMFPLWISALLGEAKMGLSNGESVATALEFMARGSHIMVERNLRSLFGMQLSLAVALWDRLGLTCLSAMTCEIFLRCHARHSVFEDELRITCRLAGILAGRGLYDDSMARLEGLDANALRSGRTRQYWQQWRGLLKLRRDLQHGDLDGAEHLLAQLLQAKADDLEPDTAFVIDLVHVEALARRGDLERAFDKAERLIAGLRGQNKDVSYRVRLLLLKASLFDRCGRPQKGFTVAMRAASIAWRARLMPLLWQAVGAVANVLTSLGEFEASAGLLVAVLPRTLECETASLVAQLYSYLGDAHMGMAGRMRPASAKRMEYMTRAKDALEQAFHYYSSVEDIGMQCETTAKMATIMKATGDKAHANDYAAKYVALKGVSGVPRA